MSQLLQQSRWNVITKSNVSLHKFNNVFTAISSRNLIKRKTFSSNFTYETYAEQMLIIIQITLFSFSKCFQLQWNCKRPNKLKAREKKAENSYLFSSQTSNWESFSFLSAHSLIFNLFLYYVVAPPRIMNLFILQNITFQCVDHYNVFFFSYTVSTQHAFRIIKHMTWHPIKVHVRCKCESHYAALPGLHCLNSTKFKRTRRLK